MTPEKLAQMFHEAYERLAPEYAYKTRDASAVPWDEVPEGNRNLMIATAGAVLAQLGWSPTCDGCGKTLSQPGAVVLAPPNLDGLCVKQHLCVDCYGKGVV